MTNKYFTEIGPNLANKINTSSVNFDTYLNTCLTFFSLKMPCVLMN